MNFKTKFNQYVKAIDSIDSLSNELDRFFLDYDLEYSVNFIQGDGACILNRITYTNAKISDDQVLRISKAKNREEILLVINELNFSF